MGYQENETITEEKKDSSLNAVSSIGSNQGYITADDILKNCANPEDVINDLDELLVDGNISVSTKKAKQIKAVNTRF